MWSSYIVFHPTSFIVVSSEGSGSAKKEKVATKANNSTVKSSSSSTNVKVSSDDKQKGPSLAATKILAVMFEKLDWDVTEVPEDELVLSSGYSRADSRGYRDGKKILLETGMMEKVGKSFKLTAKGLQERPEGVERPQQPKTNKDHQEQTYERLLKKLKVPEAKFRAFCDVLIDGKEHSNDELLKASEYKAADSRGYRDILKVLKDHKLLEPSGKRGCFQFTDKMYPRGLGQP